MVGDFGDVGAIWENRSVTLPRLHLGETVFQRFFEIRTEPVDVQGTEGHGRVEVNQERQQPENLLVLADCVTGKAVEQAPIERDVRRTCVPQQREVLDRRYSFVHSFQYGGRE
ncbi:MAG: hypothetical protein Udaeo2_28570 [Candidatus Udaeobacter sp.]|nr:MAG: hypothetical protein Udaeo2_28570 [Candidatus Udaeobacter sp.]